VFGGCVLSAKLKGIRCPLFTTPIPTPPLNPTPLTPTFKGNSNGHCKGDYLWLMVLIFSGLQLAMSQCPNLESVAGASAIGALMSMLYWCVMLAFILELGGLGFHRSGGLFGRGRQGWGLGALVRLWSGRLEGDCLLSGCERSGGCASIVCIRTPSILLSFATRPFLQPPPPLPEPPPRARLLPPTLNPSPQPLPQPKPPRNRNRSGIALALTLSNPSPHPSRNSNPYPPPQPPPQRHCARTDARQCGES